MPATMQWLKRRPSASPSSYVCSAHPTAHQTQQASEQCVFQGSREGARLSPGSGGVESRHSRFRRMELTTGWGAMLRGRCERERERESARFARAYLDDDGLLARLATGQHDDNLARLDAGKSSGAVARAGRRERPPASDDGADRSGTRPFWALCADPRTVWYTVFPCGMDGV